MDGKISKDVAVINETLKNVKDNSWAGHLSDDTSEIDFMINQLKDMLNTDIDAKTRLEVIKQLSALERDKMNIAKHLDMVMLKRSEISSDSKNKKRMEIDLCPN